MGEGKTRKINDEEKEPGEGGLIYLELYAASTAIVISDEYLVKIFKT